MINEKFMIMYSKLKDLQFEEDFSRTNYTTFLDLFKINDSEIHRKCFNSLVNPDDKYHINIKDFLVAIIGL